MPRREQQKSARATPAMVSRVCVCVCVHLCFCSVCFA